MMADLESKLDTIIEMLTRVLDQQRPQKCSASDRDALGVLLPAWGGRWGDDTVTTGEILQDPGIRGLGLGSPTAIGGLLSRAADDGLVVGGLQVIRVGRDHNATLWKLTRRLPLPVDGRAAWCSNDGRRNTK